MKTYVMTSFSRDCCRRNFVSCITSGILDRATHHVSAKKKILSSAPSFFIHTLSLSLNKKVQS